MPGLQEDREGLPFVGPAGGMLDRALAEASIDRETLFLTNTVKHFKYESRGTAKLHKRANAAEQAACRMWLAAELARVQPRLIVALGEAGLDRATLYLTNTVKHFKYETRGTAKLHKRANAAEQAACRMWLAAELARVRPRLVVALGAMAAQTLFGNTFRITRDRGQWRDLDERTQGMATWHPSAILRAPGDRRDVLYRELVENLRSVAEHEP